VAAWEAGEEWELCGAGRARKALDEMRRRVEEEEKLSPILLSFLARIPAHWKYRHPSS
jgi:hypothetical protein